MPTETKSLSDTIREQAEQLVPFHPFHIFAEGGAPTKECPRCKVERALTTIALATCEALKPRINVHVLDQLGELAELSKPIAEIKEMGEGSYAVFVAQEFKPAREAIFELEKLYFDRPHIRCLLHGVRVKLSEVENQLIFEKRHNDF